MILSTLFFFCLLCLYVFVTLERNNLSARGRFQLIWYAYSIQIGKFIHCLLNRFYFLFRAYKMSISVSLCMYACAFVRFCEQANQQITMDAGIRTSKTRFWKRTKIKIDYYCCYQPRLLHQCTHQFAIAIASHCAVSISLWIVITPTFCLIWFCDSVKYVLENWLFYVCIECVCICELAYADVCKCICLFVCVCLSAHFSVSMCTSFCFSTRKPCVFCICLDRKPAYNYEHTHTYQIELFVALLIFAFDVVFVVVDVVAVAVAVAVNFSFFIHCVRLCVIAL